MQATEANTGHPAVTYTTVNVDLFDDGTHGDGAMEPDGIYGDALPDLLTTEGTYTFHAIATYGDTCVGTREAIWSLHIDVGVDPANTDIAVNFGAPAPDGSRNGTATITPKDKYDNKLGPGRGDSMSTSGAPGSTVTSPVVDNGDGTYTVPISYGPSVCAEWVSYLQRSGRVRKRRLAVPVAGASVALRHHTIATERIEREDTQICLRKALRGSDGLSCRTAQPATANRDYAK